MMIIIVLIMIIVVAILILMLILILTIIVPQQDLDEMRSIQEVQLQDPGLYAQSPY